MLHPCNCQILGKVGTKMSRFLRKTAFCIYENKCANQLSRYLTADQCLCFCYIDSLIPLTPNFKPQAIFCYCIAQILSDLVGKPGEWFCHDTAHIVQQQFKILPIICLFHLFTSPVGAIFDVLALQHFGECAFTFLAKYTIF